MAKSYYKCGNCRTNVQIGGNFYNRAAADRLAKWHEDRGDLCGDCQQAERDAESAVCATANAEAGLPPLEGTDAQIKWAETLRFKALKLFTGAAAYAENDSLPTHDEDTIAGFREAVETLRAVARSRAEIAGVAVAEAVIRRQVDAHWWIDTRSSYLRPIIEDLRSEIEAEMSPRLPSTAEIEAQFEALLKPAGEPKSAQIAEITMVGGELLRVQFAEKHEEFRLLMRANGFRWISPYWSRSLGVLTGEPADRMAEIAHAILAAGFMVRLHHNEARAKAISGEFEPEQRRWVFVNNGGPYSGAISIVWGKEDDLYNAARKIVGAQRWSAGNRIVVPASSIEEAADFAERYGASLSPAATELLTKRRAELACGVVITEPKKRAPGRKSQTKAPKLVPVEDGVADELLDHD